MGSIDNFTVHCFFKVIKLDEVHEKANSIDIDLRGFYQLQRLNYSHEQISLIRTNFRNIYIKEGDATEEEQIVIEDELFPALFAADLPLDALFEETDDINPPVPANQPRQIWNKSLLFFLLGYLLGIDSLILAFLQSEIKKHFGGVYVDHAFTLFALL